jgi:hypothetical protein
MVFECFDQGDSWLQFSLLPDSSDFSYLCERDIPITKTAGRDGTWLRPSGIGHSFNREIFVAKNQYFLSLSDAQVTEATDAIAILERTFAGLISLDNETRRRLTKMGQKSEVFCRQTLSLLAQNPQIVPPSLNLPAAQNDLDALDRLRPVLDRLQQLAERGTDTEIALGSDIMTAALEGYGLLKVSGKNQGLDGLRKELSSRFSKTRRTSETAPSLKP